MKIENDWVTCVVQRCIINLLPCYKCVSGVGTSGEVARPVVLG